MTYIEGFVVAVPTRNREAYVQHATWAAPMIREFGASRMVECWGDDVPEGKLTDFRRAVKAEADEAIVLSWFEYPDRARRDAANQRMMQDPRMKDMAAEASFDGKRMIWGGFAAIVDERRTGTGGYTDGYVLPVPNANKAAYRALAQKTAIKFLELGAVRVVEAWGDDVPDGTVTDYRRAVQAVDGEAVVFSYVEWPDKETRDAAWGKMMEDPDMQPEGDMPFDGKRMFWGGFRPILDTQAEDG